MKPELLQEAGLIVYNSLAGDGSNLEVAKNISRSIGNIKIFNISELNKINDHSCPFVIIIGGDGTIFSVVNSLPGDTNRTFLLAGGGSENLLLKSILCQKRRLRLGDLAQKEKIEESSVPIYPGEISGVGYFLTSAGLGSIETSWAKNFQELRRKRVFLSSYAAYLKSLADNYKREDLSFEMCFTSNRLGPLKIPSAMGPSSKELLIAEITGNNYAKVAKALIAASCWRFNLPIPKGVFRVDVVDEYKLEVNSQKGISMDGETVLIKKSEYIRRGDTKLRMAILG